MRTSRSAQLPIRRRRSWLLITAVVASSGSATVIAPPLPAAAASTILVTTTLDEISGNGACSLREAVLAANLDAPVDSCAAGSGTDQIVLPAGTYALTLDGRDEDADATGDLDVLASVNIVGAGSTIDAGGIDRVLQIGSGAVVTISNVTVRGGNMVSPIDNALIGPMDMGGGVYNAGTLLLQDATVTANAIEADDGNRAGSGIGNDGALTLTRVRVVGNDRGGGLDGGGGGGIANHGSMAVSQSTIANNTAWDVGGGVENSGDARIVDSTISGNSTGCYECSARGGGVFNSGVIHITNSTISGNVINGGDYSGDASGGGLQNEGTASLFSVTLSNNQATAECVTHCFTAATGGGVAAVAAVSITNSIISGNTTVQLSDPPDVPPVVAASDCIGPVRSNGFNLVRNTDGCDIMTKSTDLVGVDPLLGALQGNGGLTFTQNLGTASPAIDAGSPASAGSGGVACLHTDQRGLARSDDGNLDGTSRCDIGAVEAAALESTSPLIQYQGWAGVRDPAASGGAYRRASAGGQVATFAETLAGPTTSVTVLTFTGPAMGRVDVTVDGVARGTVDLYSASPVARKSLVYSTSSATRHTVALTVLGTKSVASTGTEVRVDGIRSGSSSFEESSPSIAYGPWSGTRNGRALSGSFRSASSAATAAFTVVGPTFTLISERGPAFGKIRVSVDGVSKGIYDFYAPTQRWLSRQRFSGLGVGTHTVQITVLGTRNSASHGTTFVLDAVTLH